MKILSKETTEVIVAEKRNLVGIRCDICNGLISVSPSPLTGRYNKYFRVTTHHSDWGNDSIESLKQYDICPTCVLRFVTNYIDNANSTEEIEVETKHVYPKQVEYDECEDEILEER